MKYTKDLAGLYAALNDLSLAAQHDDRDEYVLALIEVDAQDASEEQIKDAHVWGSKLRMQAGSSVTSFDWNGVER